MYFYESLIIRDVKGIFYYLFASDVSLLALAWKYKECTESLSYSRNGFEAWISLKEKYKWTLY